MPDGDNDLEHVLKNNRHLNKENLTLGIIVENSEIQLMRMHKVIELERQARQLMEDSLKDKIQELLDKLSRYKITIPDAEG